MLVFIHCTPGLPSLPYLEILTHFVRKIPQSIIARVCMYLCLPCSVLLEPQVSRWIDTGAFHSITNVLHCLMSNIHILILEVR